MSSKIASCVLTAVLLSAYAGHAGANQIHVAFDVVDAATMTNEHFDAILTYAPAAPPDPPLTIGTPPSFSGYLVTAISGTQDGNPLTLPPIGATSPRSPNGVVDDLFNPGSASTHFDSLGLAYADGPDPSDIYTIFYSGTELAGCWCENPDPTIITIFQVKNFSVPEPISLTILGSGLAGLACFRRRRVY